MSCRLLRLPLALILVLVLQACGGGGGGSEPPVDPPVSDGFPTLPATGTAVAIVSEAGDPIGQGRSYAYTQANAGFVVGMSGERLKIVVQGDDQWTGEVTPISGATELRVGDYVNLPRWPDPATGLTSQTWTVDASTGATCNASTGRFRITEVQYVDGRLTRLGADFEQRCEGAAGGLRGRLRWDSQDTTRALGPTAAPAGLWQPPSGAVPASGNVVYLEGSYGFPNVVGPALLYTPANAGFEFVAGGPQVNFRIGGDVRWSGSFRAMSSLDKIQVGHYIGLSDMNSNPARGGFAWARVPSEACGLAAEYWVQVDEVQYDGERLTRLALRFERRCVNEASQPVLRGFMRWSADDRQQPASPVLPVPSGLWRPDAAAVPASGSYAYLASEPGDWLGGGATTTLTPENTPFLLYESADAIQFAFGPVESQWWGRFQGVRGAGRVEPGYYGDLVGTTPGNPARGGLNLNAPGRSCDPGGWFVVDQVSYSGSALRTLDLRFESRCVGATAALRGQLHWVSPDPVVQLGPVDGPLVAPEAPSVVPPATGSYVLVESGPDDPIGGGWTRLYTNTNAWIDVQTHIGPLTLTVNGDDRWIATIAVPEQGWVAPRVYGQVAAVAQAPDVAGLNLIGLGSCDGFKAPSSVSIDRLVMEGDRARAADFSFVAQCQTSFTPVRVRVHWEADDPNRPAGPVQPPPNELWRLPATLVPATGNYHYFHSAMGAWVGEGRSQLMTPDNATFKWRATEEGLFMQWDLAGEGPYIVELAGIRGQGGLKPGYYGGLTRVPGVHNTARGGLMVASPSRGCYGSADWFVIDDIAFDAGELTRIEARYRMRCEDVGPPVHGQIRWTR